MSPTSNKKNVWLHYNFLVTIAESMMLHYDELELFFHLMFQYILRWFYRRWFYKYRLYSKFIKNLWIDIETYKMCRAEVTRTGGPFSLNTSEMIWQMPDLLIMIIDLWVIWFFKQVDGFDWDQHGLFQSVLEAFSLCCWWSPSAKLNSFPSVQNRFAYFLRTVHVP